MSCSPSGSDPANWLNVPYLSGPSPVVADSLLEAGGGNIIRLG
jgi:hypothetical protein